MRHKASAGNSTNTTSGQTTSRSRHHHHSHSSHPHTYHHPSSSSNPSMTDDQDSIVAFGYESLLFRNDAASRSVESGALMIAWQGQDEKDKDTLWVDRYDARNLLDDFSFFCGLRDISDHNVDAFWEPSSECDNERYRDLDSDEDLLFAMNALERDDFLLRKKREQQAVAERPDGNIVDSETTQLADKQLEKFKLHFETPEGMVTPADANELARIERTAKFVNNSSDPTMEITLQVKQGTNPNFSFLSKRDLLFPFYKHVRAMMQKGAYETEKEYRERLVEDQLEAEAEEKLKQEALERAEAGSLHFDISRAIEITAEYVVKARAPQFEAKIRSLEDSRFEFLKETDPWHHYYRDRLLLAKKKQLQFDRQDAYRSRSGHQGKYSTGNSSTVNSTIDTEMESINASTPDMTQADNSSSPSSDDVDATVMFLRHVDREEQEQKQLDTKRLHPHQHQENQQNHQHQPHQSKHKHKAASESAPRGNRSKRDSFLAVSSHPVRAAEMQQLDRAQRVRELLAKKKISLGEGDIGTGTGGTADGGRKTLKGTVLHPQLEQHKKDDKKAAEDLRKRMKGLS